MKIDRVILSSNFNPVYYDFWNPLSKVYAEKFGIKPTLFWLGTEEEADQAGISNEYGDVYFINPHPNYPTPFQATWVLYWGTKFFPDEVCLICGIDEVPLSGMFIKDIVAPYADTDYVMTIADAYLPNHWTKTASPSGQHSAKGSTFMDIYKFEDSFEDEIEKITSAGVKAFWEDTEGRWGLDETYFSYKLREYPNKEIIKSLNNFALLCERRIECQRSYEPEYNMSALRSGWYAQSHLCRPYAPHKAYIDRIFENIPKC